MSSSPDRGAPTPIALIDLGDTLADCTPALQARLAELPQPESDRSAVLSTPGFWRELAPRPQGFELLRLLRGEGFFVYVVTKGPFAAPQVWADKVAWCRAHVPGVPVVVCDDKARVHGHVLVDDWLPYVDAWQRQWPEGLAIIPAQSWNADVPADAERRLRFAGGNQGPLLAALRVIRDRLASRTQRR